MSCGVVEGRDPDERLLVRILATPNTEKCPELVGQVRSLKKAGKHGQKVVCGKIRRVPMYQVSGSALLLGREDFEVVGDATVPPLVADASTRDESFLGHGRHAGGACTGVELRGRIVGFGSAPGDSPSPGPGEDDGLGWGSLLDIGLGFPAAEAEGFVRGLFESLEQSWDSMDLLGTRDSIKTDNVAEYEIVRDAPDDPSGCSHSALVQHQTEAEAQPGFYRVLAETLHVTATKWDLSEVVCRLGKGQLICICQVSASPYTGNLRGRIRPNRVAAACADAEGWVSFVHTATREPLLRPDTDENATKPFRSLDNCKLQYRRNISETVDKSMASESAVDTMKCAGTISTAQTTKQDEKRVSYGLVAAPRQNSDLEWTGFQSAPLSLDSQSTLDTQENGHSLDSKYESALSMSNSNTEQPEECAAFSHDSHDADANLEVRCRKEALACISALPTLLEQEEGTWGVDHGGYAVQQQPARSDAFCVYDGIDVVKHTSSLHESGHDKPRDACKLCIGTSESLPTSSGKWIRPSTLPRGLSIFDPLSGKSLEFADIFPDL